MITKLVTLCVMLDYLEAEAQQFGLPRALVDRVDAVRPVILAVAKQRIAAETAAANARAAAAEAAKLDGHAGSEVAP